jgi:hypothetical protein
MQLTEEEQRCLECLCTEMTFEEIAIGQCSLSRSGLLLQRDCALADRWASGRRT